MLCLSRMLATCTRCTTMLVSTALVVTLCLAGRDRALATPVPRDGATRLAELELMREGLSVTDTPCGHDTSCTESSRYCRVNTAPVADGCCPSSDAVPDGPHAVTMSCCPHKKPLAVQNISTGNSWECVSEKDFVCFRDMSWLLSTAAGGR